MACSILHSACAPSFGFYKTNTNDTPRAVYQYNPPRMNKLCAVKENIFHPWLPSYRHMERDNSTNKLPDELSRANTMLSKS